MRFSYNRLAAGAAATTVCALGAGRAARAARADIITQWNFNSPVPDATLTTGTITPSTGVGVLTLVGGTTSSFASGDSNGGSTDPATGDDFGLGLTTYPAQNTGSGAAGVQFNVSTVGFSNIVLNFDQRHSNSSSRFSQVQYTLDGATFIPFATYEATLGGDTWYNARTADFSAIAGASNNAAFGVRVVAVFDPASSASTTTATYAGTGANRFDIVTLNSASVAVPEPGTFALLGAGLLPLAGVVIRRRK